MDTNFYKLIKLVIVNQTAFTPLENIEVGFKDSYNYSMFIPKTKELLNRSLSMLKEYETTIPKVEHINVGSAKFNAEFIAKISSIMKESGETVKISLSRDYPIEIENSICKFIVAPRVDND
jgi:hypothetical protein